MSLVVTPGYTWTSGEIVTATKLNLTATPTIADGQAGSFSTITTSGAATIGGALSVTGNVYLPGAFASTSSQFQVTNTTTFADVTGLSITLSAAGTYVFRLISRLTQGAGADGGYSFQLGGTATQTFTNQTRGNYQFFDSTIANSVFGSGLMNAPISANPSGTHESMNLVWDGIIITTSTGTVTVQFAQSSAGGSGSHSNVEGGAIFSLFRIA